MRILFLAQDLPTARAPQRGRFIENHLAVLRLDHDVTAVRLDARLACRLSVGLQQSLPAEDSDTEQTLIHWNLVGPPVARDWMGARTLRDLASEHQVIHTNALETARLGWALHRATSLPWVHSEHSSEWCVPTASRPAALLTALSRRAVRSASRTTAVSRYLAEAMRAQTGLEPVVVPNVVDTSPPERPPRSCEGPIRIVTSAGLVDYKDPLLAARVVSRLHRTLDRKISWTWIGEGPLEHDFRDLVARLGLEAITQVVPPMEPEAYRATLSAADVFFLPSRFETFCVAGAEALGLGIPVVLGPRGGHLEYVDGTVGAIAAEQSVPAYVRALESVIAGVDSFDPLTLHARISNFSPESVRAGFAAVYAQVPNGCEPAYRRRTR
jgi:L-malate glycosyltransferase